MNEDNNIVITFFICMTLMLIVLISNNYNTTNKYIAKGYSQQVSERGNVLWVKK